jgi:hypothetical protein
LWRQQLSTAAAPTAEASIVENKTRKTASFLPNRNPEVDPKSNNGNKILGGGTEVCEKMISKQF